MKTRVKKDSLGFHYKKGKTMWFLTKIETLTSFWHECMPATLIGINCESLGLIVTPQILACNHDKNLGLDS